MKSEKIQGVGTLLDGILTTTLVAQCSHSPKAGAIEFRRALSG